MTLDQESLRLVDTGGQKIGAVLAGMHPLQQASTRLADFREGRSRLKAKDLVGLLLCHGARAWRSSQPVSHLRIAVRAPSGHAAVRIRFQRTSGLHQA